MPLDFPSSPTNGQVYGNYYYNSARGAWNALLPAATPNFFTNATLNTSTLIDATATSSLISTVPLTINGLSGQTANIQEWKSNGVLNAFVNSYGGAKFVDLKINTSSSLGSLGIIPGLASQVGIVIRGAASQTANLQEWQDSSGTVASQIDSIGRFNSSKAINVGGFTPGSTFLGVQTTAATPAVIIKGGASQTADLQQWQSSTGAVLSEINSAGELQVPRIGVGSIMPTTTQLYVTSAAAANIGLVVQGAASQTANLQEWKNSAGIILADIDNLGNLQTSKIGLGGIAPTSGYIIDGSGRVKLRSDGSNSSGIWLTGSDGSESVFMGMASNASSGQTGFYHNGAWRFLIDSSGRINTPSQPAFFAYRTDGLWASQVWIANQTYFNIGSHYNTSNGRFTAPVAGRYFFAINAIGHTSGTTRLYPRINGANQFGSFHLRAINTANYGDAHMTWIFNLSAGDYVDILLGEGYNYSDSSPYAFWQGFLLH